MMMLGWPYLGIAVGRLADDNVGLELLEPSDEVDHVGSGLRSEIFFFL